MLTPGHPSACCAMAVSLRHAFLLLAQATDLGRRIVDVSGLVRGRVCRKLFEHYMKDAHGLEVPCDIPGAME
eukprot:s167_g28.t1